MIDSFTGPNRFLSNFWPAEVSFEGITYPTVEHAYQAAKTLDVNARLRIRDCTTPGQAKRMARTITIRKDWDAIKRLIMMFIVGQKFIKHKELRQKLIATGDQELIEGNHWGDTFWGVCNGKGENHLGKILMHVRHHLKHGELP